MKRAAIIAAVLCLLLSGCVPLTSELHPLDSQYEMPLPNEEPAEPAIGDAVAGRTVEATLYFPSADSQGLVPAQASVFVAGGDTLPRRLAEALLETDPPKGAQPVAPEGTSVLSVLCSGGAAVVNLSIDARGEQAGKALLLMRAAIVRTLCGASGVSAVDVLAAGRAEWPFELPSGAGMAGQGSVSAQWAQAQAEDGQAKDGETAVERAAVLYYPSRDGRHIIPQLQALTITGGDAITPALDALTAGEGINAALMPALPDADNPLVTSADIVTLASGLRVVRLTFDGNLAAILERARLSAWQTYAAITCTLTEFIPGLDGVQIYVGDGQLTRLDTPRGEIALTGGVMTREMFERMIGVLSTIYMTASDGSLKPLGRAMAPEDVVSPRMLIAPLFGEPAAWEENTARVIPDGLSVDDLLGVRLEDGEATLNFSAAFYAGCQRLTPQQERNLIYALVNTLTERDDVKSVRFQIEGETVSALAHDINLLGPLMRNPGLIRE